MRIVTWAGHQQIGPYCSILKLVLLTKWPRTNNSLVSSWLLLSLSYFIILYTACYCHHNYTSLSLYQYSRTRRWRKFQKGKIYNAEEHVAIESFVTTLIHWTFFSDDANKVGICWLCRSGQLHVTPSSRWSLPRCHRSVRNDMRLFLRTKQYPVQLRTTKYYSRRYYSSTTKY